MPIYEYRCENDHRFEVIQRMIEEPLTSCETCGAPAVRVLSAPAVHFKGSGFYNTDYGTKKRQREKEASSSSSDSKSSEGSSGDSKKSDSSSDSGSSSDSSSKSGNSDSGPKKEKAAPSGS